MPHIFSTLSFQLVPDSFKRDRSERISQLNFLPIVRLFVISLCIGGISFFCFPPAKALEYSKVSEPFMWPTQTKAPVVRNFDPPAERWLAGHRGVDIEGHVGQVIVSPAQGVVAFSGVINHVGIVSIDHPNGIRTTYQPLHERIDAGSVVAKGQKIGVLASDPSGPRLHWGAKTGKYTYVNPMRLLYPKIVLKPW